MIHQRLVQQPLILVLCSVLLSCSTASSFGTGPQTSSFSKQFRIRTPTPSTSSPLFTRGGSDEPSSTAEQTTAIVSDTVAAATSTSLTATSDDDDSSSEEEESVVSSPMGPNSSPPGFLRKLFPSVPWHTLPNQLTYARCVAIPGLIAQFYMSRHPNKNMHSSLIFAIASLTDYLDGYLARRWDICSPFGAFLDPVADKLMVSTALILLTGKYGYAVAIPSAIILAREIAVSALREWMASKGLRDSVKVGFQGKVKTAATMVALTVVLSVPDAIGLKWDVTQLFSLGSAWQGVMSLGMALLFLSSFVTITSGSVYFKAAAPVLMGKE